MLLQRGSQGALNLGLFSLGCLVTWVLGACSSPENSGSKSTDAGSSPGGNAAVAGTGSSAAGTSAAGATSGASATAGATNQPSGGAAGSAVGGANGSGNNTGGSSAAAGTSGTGGAVTGDRSPEATCTRWRADTANMAEGTWSGDVATCMAGDISAEGRENALRLFNLMRWIADLPAVATEDARNQQAQACALMMTANDALSHTPPMDWKCYTELGYKGANTSNISSGPGVSSVISYMVDTGNETTFGHRRIILSNELGPIGLGSAGKDGASCMQNIGGTGKAGKAWMAWPPPGAFPMQAYVDAYRRSLDETGWSIQASTKGAKIDLSAAQVAVTSAGQARPVKVEQLTGTYGQATAIRIVPDGWKAAAGSTYSVSVTGTTTPIAYEFQLVDCK
jgi:uncharacterized protein YkwD